MYPYQQSAHEIVSTERGRRTFEAVKMAIATMPSRFTAGDVINAACDILSAVETDHVMNSLDRLIQDGRITELTFADEVRGQDRVYEQCRHSSTSIGTNWYTEDEVRQYLTKEDQSLLHRVTRLTNMLNAAFNKGKHIGKSEVLDDLGGESAILEDHVKLREWRRERGLSMVPLSERFNCTVVEVSSMERGKPVRAELVRKAQALLANPDK